MKKKVPLTQTWTNMSQCIKVQEQVNDSNKQ